MFLNKLRLMVSLRQGCILLFEMIVFERLATMRFQIPQWMGWIGGGNKRGWTWMGADYYREIEGWQASLYIEKVCRCSHCWVYNHFCVSNGFREACQLSSEPANSHNLDWSKVGDCSFLMSLQRRRLQGCLPLNPWVSPPSKEQPT